ncbi:hypothetical protein [Rhodoblastus sp.]|uniref:hypothetical protein n=1 Tax=Rhodoblastus sp. TaxID=1962975 RepID=UPI003F9839FC
MTQNDQPDTTVRNPGWVRRFLVPSWPYLVMLLLALTGVALSSLARGLTIPYWEIVVPIFAVASFFARGDYRDRAERIRAIRQDALHWIAVFAAMRLLMLPQIFELLGADAAPLVLLTVLALGLFTSGNLIGSWRVGLLGVLLAAAVPATAWMERSTLLILLSVAGAVSLFLFIWPPHSWSGRAKS